MNTEDIGVAAAIPGVVYPPREILSAYVSNGTLPSTTLVAALRSSMKRHAERVALSCGDRTLSYADLDDQSSRMALGLSNMGLKQLDRVIFQVPNSIELVVALVACLKGAFIPVCTLEAHREREIGFLASLSGARAHVLRTDSDKFDFADFATLIGTEVPTMTLVVSTSGPAPDGGSTISDLIHASGFAEAEAFVDSVDHEPFQVAVFQLSGGTTSVPKIIPRFSNEYLYNAQAMVDW